MTRLTRDTALPLMPEMAIQPNMCMMIMTTTRMMMRAAHKFRPINKNVTTNTAPEQEI